ncbi:MAG: dipeptidase [Daejeonella sp.]|uniref:dipeptidase n=1 Tax=Daejeonella sp. TaxID=2805397 RepID=UPI0027340EA9|nr:dipeptidase [Daejeonella sp.]MDP3469133.1 dipeptidase [Daejeonella sp.]
MKRRDIIKCLTILPIAEFSTFNLFGNSIIDEYAPLLNSASCKSFLSDLHKNAFVMDGHIHMMTRQLLQGLDIGDRYPDGHVDLPRAIEGGLDAMFFSCYTPEPYYPDRHELKNTFRVVELALAQIEKNNHLIELAHTASDIVRINRKGKMAAFLDLEGGFDLDGDLNILRALYRLGLRSVQLTAHNETNAFIDSCYGEKRWGGINAHGRTVVTEMNKLGMLINVAHASDDAILQTVEASSQPVIYSHGGFRGIVNSLRCITDECAKALAAKGGVIGIQFGSSFNNPKYAQWVESKRQAGSGTIADPIERKALSIEEVDQSLSKGLPFVHKGVIPDEYWMGTDQLAKVIDYGVRLVGEDHIALGSDFDGGPPLPREIKDVSDYPQMTYAMQKLGYSEERIRKILGLNWLRVIREVTEKK